VSDDLHARVLAAIDERETLAREAIEDGEDAYDGRQVLRDCTGWRGVVERHRNHEGSCLRCADGCISWPCLDYQAAAQANGVEL
jgi:hypothetical protein